MNSNWPRWIFASLSKHLKTVSDAVAFKMYIEGQNRHTRDDEDFFEFRMDGPNFQVFTRGSYEAYIEVNLAIQSVMDDHDYHKIHRFVGYCADFLDPVNPIPVYKLGTGVDDDGSQIGCLNLQVTSRNERIVIAHFGIVDVDKRVMQASVEAHYTMELSD
jgi:hypothetical protein